MSRKLLVVGLDSTVNGHVCKVLQDNSIDAHGFVFKKEEEEMELERIKEEVSKIKFDGAIIGHGVQRTYPEIANKIEEAIRSTESDLKMIFASSPATVLSEIEQAFCT